MGCHHANTPFRALKLTYPASVSAMSSKAMPETAPLASVVTYKFPAREDMPPLRVVWYDGGLKPLSPRSGFPLGGSGEMYQGRLPSFPVQDDDHYDTVCGYVERNSLRASLVERAEDCRWGSLYRWSRGTPQQKSLLAAWPLPRRPGWIEHVNKPQTRARKWRQGRGRGPAGAGQLGNDGRNQPASRASLTSKGWLKA
jgi:hypothetical protein